MSKQVDVYISHQGSITGYCWSKKHFQTSESRLKTEKREKTKMFGGKEKTEEKGWNLVAFILGTVGGELER